MQVLKKTAALTVCMLLWGCSVLKINQQSQQSISYEYGKPADTVALTDYSHVDLGTAESFRVAMLLPLSGKFAETGNGMKNAAMMAVGDLDNNNVVLQFYDTLGTTSGARIAVENAVNAKSNLILGPLLSEEVAAISSVTKDKNIPVISFSTAPSVLQGGVYTLGLLNEEQIDRIVRYAVEKGRTKLAVVLPDSQSGINMYKSAMRAAGAYGATVVKVGFYPPETMDFTGLVTSMAGAKKVAASQAKAGENAEYVAVDFDALLVPEYGNRLKSITSMFSFYDIAAPDVLFFGTSVWANTNLSKETELYGAAYPVMSTERQNAFAQKYKDMFGEKPNSLNIFAYDAVALATSLARKDRNNLDAAITNPDGYFGMSGAFRIFANGKSEHGLDIVRVTAGGQRVVENAPQKFYSMNPEYSRGADYDDFTTNMPMIYGKNVNDLRSVLINVQ
jgi:ABC-type branched-subunit amino acid transport system substrate-binding protein